MTISHEVLGLALLGAPLAKGALGSIVAALGLGALGMAAGGATPPDDEDDEEEEDDTDGGDGDEPDDGIAHLDDPDGAGGGDGDEPDDAPDAGAGDADGGVGLPPPGGAGGGAGGAGAGAAAGAGAGAAAGGGGFFGGIARAARAGLAAGMGGGAGAGGAGAGGAGAGGAGAGAGAASILKKFWKWILAALVAIVVGAIAFGTCNGGSTGGAAGSGGSSDGGSGGSGGNTNPPPPASSSGNTTPPPPPPPTASGSAATVPGCPPDLALAGTAENIHLYLGFVNIQKIPGKVATGATSGRLMLYCDKAPMYDGANDLSNIDGITCHVNLPGCFIKPGKYPMTAASGPLFGQPSDCFQEPMLPQYLFDPAPGGLGIECPKDYCGEKVDQNGLHCLDYTPCDAVVPASNPTP